MAFRLRPGLLGPPVRGERRLLGGPVHVVVTGAGGLGVVGGSAHRARHAVDELGGELRGDAPEAPLPQTEPRLVCGDRSLAGRRQRSRGPGLLRDERVTPAGGLQPPAGRVEPSGQLFGTGGRLLGPIHAGPQLLSDRVPARQPCGRLLDQLVVGRGLPVDPGPFVVDLPAAPLGTAGGVERAELCPELALPAGQLIGARVGQFRRQQGADPFPGLGGRAVGAVGRVAEFQRGRDQVRLAGACQLFTAPVVFRTALLESRGPAAGLRVPLLEPGEFPFGVEGAAGVAVAALHLGQDRPGDPEPFACAAACDGRPFQDPFGQPRFAGPVLRQLRLGGGPGRLGDALGEGEDLLVGRLHPGLGRAPQFRQALLHGGEPAGVEEPAEQLAPRLGVGAQETGEVPLGQEHHLAELVPAHADELGDLLADLLVRAAEPLPARVGTVFAEPALRLLRRDAAAPPLGAGLGGPPGDLQPAPADGQLQADLGRQIDGCVVAAQGRAGALPGARHRRVQRVADGVQDAGLARAGRPVEEEETGRRQRVEVDFLGGAEGSEGGEGQSVQPQRDTSFTVSSTRTSSKAARSTVRSCALAPLPPRTWATKSSAIWWSSRPSRRWA